MANVRLEKKLLIEQMQAQGLSHRAIAAELARRYGLRPRTAWREAHGWSLTEASARINAFRGGTGLDLDGSCGMTAPHLSEYERWPGFGPQPNGRKPTPRFLAELAAVYGCSVADLIDTTDQEHLPSGDLLVIGANGAMAQRSAALPPAAEVRSPAAAPDCVVLIFGNLPARIVLEMPGEQRGPAEPAPAECTPHAWTLTAPVRGELDAGPE